MAQPQNPAPPGRPPEAADPKRNPAPPGRPLKGRQRRERVIRFRVTKAEFDAFRKEGAPAGLSPHECARLKATGGAPLPLPPAYARAQVEPEPPGMFELRQELRRVGVNMNQIARSLHMTGEHEPGELREASQHLNEIFARILEGRTIH
jgi:hypothetical protein